MGIVTIHFISYDDDEFSPETRAFIKKPFRFRYSPLTTVGHMFITIYRESGFINRPSFDGFDILDYLSVVYNEEYRSFRCKSARLKPFLRLMGQENGDLTLHWVYRPGGGASIYEEEGIKFLIHTDEYIHRGRPHVHVEYGGQSMVINLQTYKTKGTLKDKKKEKKAVAITQKHHDHFLRKWREWVCGLEVSDEYYCEETQTLHDVIVG